MSRQAMDNDTVELDLTTLSAVNVMVTTSRADDRMVWARAIHDRGPHPHGPFVTVCLTLNGRLRAGDIEEWFARASDGTLFIDDIGELSSDAQAWLSSFLSIPTGRGGRPTPADANGRVRVVAGSGRSLREDVAVGAFDSTLFYRLNLIHINPMHHDRTGENSMKAREIMSHPPYSCAPDTNLASVEKIMWDHDCGFVPVVDASGLLVGVVTDRACASPHRPAIYRPSTSRPLRS